MLRLILFYFSLLPWWLAWSWTDPTAKPGCPSYCGTLLIEYPFGIGPNCSFNEYFNIICDGGVAVLEYYNGSVALQMNETEIRVRVNNSWAYSCLTMNETQTGIDLSYDPVMPPYSVSTKNWLTGIGCAVLATASNGTSGTGTGCLASCPHDTELSGDATCEGTVVGCCQTPFVNSNPSYNYISVTNSFGYSWQLSYYKVTNCGYAFIGEKQTNITFPFPNLIQESFLEYNTTTLPLTTPIVLNWRVGLDNCTQAVLRSDYACQDNASCVDLIADDNAGLGGYLCQCKNGYTGNPYLSPGCSAIDYCVNRGDYCTSISRCVNVPGGYQCICPVGYDGNGSIVSGLGCHRLPNFKIFDLGIGLGSSIGFLLLLLSIFYATKLCYRMRERKKRRKYFKQNGGLLLRREADDGYANMTTKLFDASELNKATDDFHASRILGRGGQGTVYKGILSDGKIVAIKKSKLENRDQVADFINEVRILSQINHKNIVRLLGCCLETEVPLIVYEFIPNGTLHALLHDKDNEFPFPWNMRLKMAAEIAGAVAYLHSASSIPIFHRDIKSSNILLDERYVAKVSDFGASKTIPDDKTHLTTNVKGTIGYLDPEYVQSSQYTEKSDVYSFGVVLVELLIGQRPFSIHSTTQEKSPLYRFFEAVQSNQVESVLDPQVSSEPGKIAEVVAVARLARRCLNLKGRSRPTMKEVAMELESVRKPETPFSTAADEEEEVFMEGSSHGGGGGFYTGFAGETSWSGCSIDRGLPETPPPPPSSMEMSPVMIRTI